MATNITDLPLDVLRRIISVVAKSPGGARDVARSLLTCQRFLKASNNIVIHRAACFENVQILDRSDLFQRTNGLLNHCAKAGNPLAEHLLTQVILVTCTQLVENKMTKSRLNRFCDYSPKYRHRRDKKDHDIRVAALFMVHYTPVPGSNPTSTQESDPNPSLSFHWEFVKAFLLKSTPSEIEHMSVHVYSYIELFTGRYCNSDDIFAFLSFVKMLRLVGMSGEKNWLLHYENDDYILFRREGFIPPPNTEIIDLWRSGGLFEDIRAKMIDAFKVIIPQLR